MNKFLKELNLFIFKVERINTHGGSIRVYVSQDKNMKIDVSVENMIKEEEKYGLKKLSTYINFGKKIQNLKKQVLENLKLLKIKNENIIGYGAPAKATTALNFFNIKDEINYIIEDNQLKHGKYLPGVNIKFYQKKMLN